MAKNVGGADRVVRIVLGLGLGFLVYQGVIVGSTAALIAGIVAAYFLLTGLIAMDPIYKMIDVDTTIQEQPYSTTDDRAGL